jgi:hypothetical protein
VNPSIGGTFVGYTANPIDNTETRSIFFDGSNDYIQTNYIPYFTSDFTLEVFAKFTRYNDYQCILSSANNGGAGSGFWFEFGTGRGFTIYTTGSQLILEDNIVSLTNLELNKWHHIVATRSGSGTSNLKLYVNNILCGQNTSNAALGHTSLALMVGKYDYVGNYSYFKGNVGSVKIYNKGLNTDEILQNYNATKKKYNPDENIVRNGLVFYVDPANSLSYPGSGSYIYDLSGFNNTGTLANSPAFFELNGGSLGFNGTNSYITFGNKFSFTSESFTFSSWVFVNSFTTNQANQGPIVFYKGNFNENGYYLQIFGNGDMSFITNNGSNQSTSSITGAVKLNIWHHISIVRNGSSVRIYCDGIDVTLTAGTHQTIFASTRDFYLANYNNFIFANIRISQFLLHNRALTQQEIQQNYNATKNRFVNALPPVRNGLVLELDAANRASYPGTGNTWYDLSGNSLNGTLTNGPTFSGIGATSSIVTDGSNDYITSDVNKTVIGSSLTISFLFSTSSASGGLLEISDSIGTGVPWIFLIRTSSSQINWYLDGDYRLLVSLASNENALMSITYSNNLWSIYKNGVLQGTSTSGLGSYGGNNLRLGVGYSGNTATKWNLFTIYNRALSAYEVKQNFDFYRTRYNI